MSTRDDLQFLALLVHRGHLSRAEAEPLLASLKAGADLDEVLADQVGWDEATVARMRRTRSTATGRLRPRLGRLWMPGGGSPPRCWRRV